MINDIFKESLDIFIDFVNQDENKQKIRENVINPITSEISTRLGKYIFILFLMYIVVLILIIYIIVTLLSKHD